MSRTTLLLVAAAFFGAAAVSPMVLAFSFAAAGLSVALVGWRRTDSDPDQGNSLPAGVAVVMLSLVAVVAPLTRVPSLDLVDLALWQLPILLAVLLIVIRSDATRDPAGRLALYSVALLLLAPIGSGLVLLAEDAGAPGGVDVYVSHLAAAAALQDGSNPYTDAVRFHEGAPRVGGSPVLEGYVYPPVALGAYAVSTWVLGDPRWLNLLSWAFVLGSVAMGAVRGRASLVALAVLAAAPSWRLVVYSGWTEPLTLALIAAAVVWWRRPRVSGVLLGLALASKQYMILLLPLLLLARASRKDDARLAVAIGTAVLTFVPFLVWDWRAILDAVVTRQLSQGFRTDIQSLAGVLEGAGGMGVYIAIGVGAVLWLSWWLARSKPRAGSLMSASALVLAGFFVASQALVNYWFFVSALLALGLALNPWPTNHGDGRASESQTPC